MTEWLATRLKFLAAEPIRNGLGESGIEGEPEWPRYIRTTDIAGPRQLRTDIRASLPPEVAHRSPLRTGDIVMTAAGATIGKSLLYTEQTPACYAGYLAKFSPGSAADSRFIAYWMESAAYWAQIETGKVVSTIENFSASKYANLRLDVPDLEVQRAIADYLDAETTRIDALIAKKEQLIHLLEERWAATLAEAFNHPSGLRLKHVLAAPMAYGVLVPDHVADGPMMLRISDFRRGDPDPGSVARISETLHRQYRRTIVQEGDLVVSVVGTLGRAGIVPRQLAGANLNRPLARVQVRPEAPVDLIRMWCGSSPFADQVELVTGSDSAQPTLNLGDLKNFTLGLPPSPSEWESLHRHLRLAEAWRDRARAAVLRQIDLLVEHRQALITAAVTGEFVVPGAA